MLGKDGAAIGRRELSLRCEPSGEPTPPSEPDVPGALSMAIEARELLPNEPIAARVKVQRVIELLT